MRVCHHIPFTDALLCLCSIILIEEACRIILDEFRMPLLLFDEAGNTLVMSPLDNAIVGFQGVSAHLIGSSFCMIIDYFSCIE